ncbi:MAG: hypothetical protein ACRDRS_11670 [Pseudonocardiaceae bacterium]
MKDQPGLFELASLDVAAPARSGRGRARETYARTVVADVTIQNRDTLRTAALRAFSGGIVLLDLPSDEPDDLPDTQEEIATSDAAAVQWCLEPTTGMELLLESGVVRILSIAMGCDEVEPEPKSGAATQVRAWWTITVRIGDAAAARELALAACPVTDAEARAEIERSFSAVWHWTAPPYAPMAGIAGVTWAPISVTVEQILARRSRSEQ